MRAKVRVKVRIRDKIKAKTRVRIKVRTKAKIRVKILAKNKSLDLKVFDGRAVFTALLLIQGD
jgi:hypothetical protein